MKRSTQQLLWYGGGAVLLGGLGYLLYKANSGTAAASGGSTSPPNTIGPPTITVPTWTAIAQPWALVAGKTYRMSVPVPAAGISQALGSFAGGNNFSVWSPNGSGGFTPALPTDWPTSQDPSTTNTRVQFTSVLTTTFPMAMPGAIAFVEGP